MDNRIRPQDEFIKELSREDYVPSWANELPEGKDEDDDEEIFRQEQSLRELGVEPEYPSSEQTQAQNNAIKDSDMFKEVARRNLTKRFDLDPEISEEELFDEFLDHYRSFNVNELTAALDFNYVSGLAADAKGETGLSDDARKEAQQELADYRYLYTAFKEMPNFQGGAFSTALDYTENILKAPSTLFGLILPGVGKGAGVATAQAAKAGVGSILRSLFKPGTYLPSNMVKAAAANPLKTAIGVEIAAAAGQNTAAQNTEIEASLRDDFSMAELGTSTVLAGSLAALPAAAGLLYAKGKARDFIERNTGDLLDEADKAELARIKKAEEEALETIGKNKETVSKIETSLAPLQKRLPEIDPDKVARGKAAFADQVDDISTPFSIHFDPDKDKRLTALVVDFMGESGYKYDQSLRVSENIANAADKLAKDFGEKSAEKTEELFNKYNLTGDDFANLLMTDIAGAIGDMSAAQASMAGSTLAARANAKRVLNKLTQATDSAAFGLDKETKKLVKGAINKAADNDHSIGLQELDQLRRSLMTSQVATTVRNVASGYARVGFDTVMRGMDTGLRYFLGKKKLSASDRFQDDTFAIAFGLINRKETDAINEIFKRDFSQKAGKMFRAMRDVENLDLKHKGKLSKLEMIGKEANVLNTIADNFFKSAAFSGYMKRGLNDAYSKAIREGRKVNSADYNLIEIIRSGKFKQTFNKEEFQKIMDKAIDDTLYFTYQKTPESKFGRGFINTINATPFLGTSLIPFARFTANAMRFTYEFSPFYLYSLGKNYKTLVKDADNYEEVAKAMIGSGAFLGAYIFRNSEYAGDKWYEGKLPDGTTFDLRPFFPTAPYLWFADMYIRQQNGTISEASPVTSFIQAITGTQFRAGFGIYALDSAVKDIASLYEEGGSTEAIGKLAANAVGNIISTYSMPSTMVQDVYNTFAAPDAARIVRDSKDQDFWSTLVRLSSARIPGNYRIDELIAESRGVKPDDLYENPMRAGVLRRETPLTRQTYGILKQSKRNFFEKEVERLGMSKKFISSKTGVPEADNLIDKFMGEFVEDVIVPTLQNDEKYKKLTPKMQKQYLKDQISGFKQDLRKTWSILARQDDVQKAFIDKYRFNPILAAEFNQKYKSKAYVKEEAFKAYHEQFGQPDDRRDYDYKKLLDLAERISRVPLKTFAN